MDKKVEEKKENIVEDKNLRIAGSYIGKYAMSYLNKLYAFEFPVEARLEENLEVLNKLRDEIIKGIETMKKNKEEAEKKKEESEKVQK